MRKHRDADELAKRILEAANKPPGITSPPAVAAPVPNEPPKQALTELPEEQGEQIEPVASPPVKTEVVRGVKKTAKRESRKQAANDDRSVPMTLRPSRSTLQRYLEAASQRTLSAGRVVSVQDVMLEFLENGP